MSDITEFARAKINLTLRVLGRRADGLHALESLVVFAHSVGDQLSLRLGTETSIAMQGPFGGAVVGENILDRTIRAVLAAGPSLRLGRIRLDKLLPVASGIGGGSADAAALIRAVRRANPELESQIDWHGVAATLGADVPVCLRSEPVMMRGIGHDLTRLEGVSTFDAVLVNPRVPVPTDKTAQVFRRLAARVLPDRHEKDDAPCVSFMNRDSLLAALEAQGNDLTDAALQVVPAIADVLAALQVVSGCRLARLSGAGPTCFGLFGSSAEADAAATRIAAAHPQWWVRPTLLA